MTDVIGDRPHVPAQVFSAARLAAVHRTGLLDTEAEEPFDRLACLAATLVSASSAFVTVVDERRSFWKSCVGAATAAGVRENPVEQSFCQYVIGTGEPLIVGDTTIDPRTRDNPSVLLMGVAAWAGYPVRAPDGAVLGTFCVVDLVTREWTPRDREILSTLAHAASGEVSLRMIAADAQRATVRAQEQTQRAEQYAHILQESLLPAGLPDVPGLQLAARYTQAVEEPR
jgi:GAF domain-containing protein